MHTELDLDTQPKSKQHCIAFKKKLNHFLSRNIDDGLSDFKGSIHTGLSAQSIA